VRIFAFTFIAVAAVGLIYTFVQPAIYQSEATLLTSAQASIDSLGTEADSQHVAIQRQILLGDDLIAETRARLEAQGDSVPDATAFERQLMVQAVPGTNLVALVAQGSDAELLPRVVNTWIDAYLDARAADIEQISGHTVRLIRDELEQLAIRLQQSRAELAAFRETNELISEERNENEALARLGGLQQALNAALEEEVKARSTEETLREADARGETVIPRNSQRDLNQKEAKLQRLEKQMAELDEKYTREYLELRPALKAIPQEIDALTAEIASLKSVGNQKVLEQARQDHAAASRAVRNIRQQYEEHKQQVKEFSAIFVEHRTRVSDLENLENLNRETTARLTQIETRQVGKYPQVTIISRATSANSPIGPDYTRNSLISLAVALATAVFAVWLVGFLNPAIAPNSRVSTSNVYLHRGGTADVLVKPGDSKLEHDPSLALGINPDDQDEAALQDRA
jgi:uncharacterized protein involved in exopolysaccharide biosynthesis